MIIAVDTDWDFSVKFKGITYSGHKFAISFDSVEELDQLEIRGPHGSPGDTGKSWEFKDALKQIKQDPTVAFDTTGGNRGVRYMPEL